jgi:hypothetical protein
MKDQIIQYLSSQLTNTLVGYEVNGNPTKRYFLIRSIALSQYLKMSDQEKRKILKKIKSK